MQSVLISWRLPLLRCIFPSSAGQTRPWAQSAALASSPSSHCLQILEFHKPVEFTEHQFSAKGCAGQSCGLVGRRASCPSSFTSPPSMCTRTAKVEATCSEKQKRMHVSSCLLQVISCPKTWSPHTRREKESQVTLSGLARCRCLDANRFHWARAAYVLWSVAIRPPRLWVPPKNTGWYGVSLTLHSLQDHSARPPFWQPKWT